MNWELMELCKSVERWRMLGFMEIVGMIVLDVWDDVRTGVN